MKFTDFNFNELLMKGIQDAGFENCTAVQEESFKILQDKRDVLAQSQTGTGKTAAFLIGMYQLMLEEEKFKGTTALVIVPTRELAIQVEREAKLLSTHLDFKIGSFYGGVGYQQQEKMLKDGLDLIIGTPGRLIDFNKSKKLDMSKIGILVVDEADRLFDMGFYPDLIFMMKRMPKPGDRLTLLFSATMSTRVANLSWEHMKEPGEVIIEPEQITVDGIQQELYHVGVDEKMALLLGLFNREKPKSAVIFCNTRYKVYEVAKRLEVNGYDAKYLIGDLPQNKRTQIVDQVKKGEVPFLVATDVAARGLHIDDLPLVINYDVPNDAENYVHRIGRTARAGKEGKAFTLACEEYVLGLPAVEEYIERKIPVVWAEEDLYVEDKSRGMSFRLNDLKRDGTIKDRGGRDGGRGGRGGRDGYRGGRDGGRGGRDGGRGGRDGNRDGYKGSRDGNRDRNRNDNRPDNRSGDGRRRDGQGPRKPDPRVQSAVAMVAGSDKDFDKDKGPSRGKTKSSGSNRNGQKHRNEGQRRPSGSQKSYKGKNHHSRSERKPLPAKNISSDSSLDSRLDYYRQKYGEDFVPTNVSDIPKGDKKKSSKGGSKNKNSQKQNNRKPKSSAKGQNTSKGKSPQNSKKGAAKAGSKKEEKKTEKKKGFLGRLFGKK